MNPQVQVDVSLDDIVYGLANQGRGIVEKCNPRIGLDTTGRRLYNGSHNQAGNEPS